ncbi:MAG: 4-hydroxybenzoate octaprenyltransferase [Prolixibacteraceae bacterium]|jgi:4-hydroxybenzoate polyprenyltransferase|nr:4-hydroxybenzoate octaprenyltransferase [Prolixibacteraceae bacterium]MBT6004597.1 4-hydroxybenzoate octaprenyltransferase [Prolixibacteraceae bacterium]MBT6764984.1 4-hydroxybenzoate octaprenyltransferase [Prolixibacteraceae bacterium]MBT6997829.1 4-hydroxybenzoate octaprenyltransferase [Prolixibacteraceae bacterium]MBT7394774.1 4-hydroxybenzoate octaprenyltransferase [Prolixibacteraceae bacterium]
MVRITNYLKLVKFEHTIFALPFALLGFFFALEQEDSALSFRLLILVLLCMVFARNAAMGFNRFLDREFDKLNPRTALREIPAGILKPKSVLFFVIINVIFFVATTWFINSLCFYLSPIALFVILFYSYTKRFTPLCHFVLSLGLAIAPMGAYLAVAGKFDWLPLLLSFVVFFWVSGFDIIYALQDEDFDNELKLKSIPALLGKRRALNLSKFIHFISVLFVISVAITASGNWIHWLGAALFSGLLFYQHTLVKATDLSKVNLAFFTTNGIASVIYGLFLTISLFI